MKVLFIGGQEDGKWLDVTEPLRDYVMVDEQKDFDLKSWSTNIGPDTPSFKLFRYRLHLFASGSQRLSIYAIDSVKTEDILSILMQGYKKP